MKKVFLSILSLLIIAAVIFSGTLCAIAEDPMYGTSENGIYTKPYSTHLLPATEKFMNGDFEQGLMYWARSGGEGNVTTVQLKEENGNKYISFSAEQQYEGIVSPRFKIDTAKVGQQLVLIYDWRGISDFQIYLAQMRMNAKETGCVYTDEGTGFEKSADIRLAQGAGTVLKEATNDEEWNTTMTYPRKVVAEPSAENPNMYFIACVQVMGDPSVEADIDNLRLALYRDKERKVYSLDGTTVLYDIEAIENAAEEEFEEDEEEYEEDEEEDTDTDADTDTDTDADVDANVDEDSNDTDSEDSNFSNAILWICIAGGVVVVAAAVVIVLVVIKNKKNLPEDADQDTPASEE